MKPAISLPVYFKSVKIWKYVLREKKPTTTKGPKKRKKTFPTAWVEPQASSVEG